MVQRVRQLRRPDMPSVPQPPSVSVCVLSLNYITNRCVVLASQSRSQNTVGEFVGRRHLSKNRYISRQPGRFPERKGWPSQVYIFCLVSPDAKQSLTRF